MLLRCSLLCCVVVLGWLGLGWVGCCCVALCCVVLCCVVLCCVVLCCVVLCCVVLCCVVLCSVVLCCENAGASPPFGNAERVHPGPRQPWGADWGIGTPCPESPLSRNGCEGTGMRFGSGTIIGGPAGCAIC